MICSQAHRSNAGGSLGVRPGGVVFAALLVVAVTMDCLPDVAQSLYWGQGMRSLLPPLVLLPLCAALAWPTRNDAPRRWSGAPMAAVAVLTLVAGGFSETFVALQTALLGMALLAGWCAGSPKIKSQVVPVLAAGLVGSLIALSLVIMAPGNRARQAYYPSPPGLLALVRTALTFAAHVLGKFLLVARPLEPLPILHRLLNLLVGLAFPTLMGGGVLFSRQEVASLGMRTLISSLLVIPALTFILMLACLLPGVYGLSAMIPLRTFVIPYFVLIVGLTCWGYLGGQLLCRLGWIAKLEAHPRATRLVRGAVVVLFVANTLWSTARVLDTRSVFRAYAQAWDKSHQWLLASKAGGLAEVVMQPLSNPSGLGEVTANPNDSITKCVWDYYGLAVLVEPKAD